jgi:hypothetical protein
MGGATTGGTSSSTVTTGSSGGGGTGGASSSTVTTGSSGGGGTGGASSSTGGGGTGSASSSTATTGSAGGGGSGGIGSTSSSSGAGGSAGAPGGEMVWTRVFPVKNQQTHSAQVDHLSTDSAGMILMGGRLQGGIKFDAVQSLDSQLPANIPAACVIKLDGASGNHLWSSIYGSVGDVNQGSSTFVAADGAGTLTAGMTSLGPSSNRSYLWKFGGAPWQKIIGAGGWNIFLRGLKADAAGNIRALFFSGQALPETWDYGGGPVKGLALVGYNAAGQHLFSKSVSDFLDPGLSGDDAGNTYIAGAQPSTLTKFDSSGNVTWSKVFASPPSSIPISIHVGPSGDLWALAYYQGTIDFGGGPLASGANKALAIVKLDAMGNQVWAKLFQSPDFVSTRRLSAAGGGELVLMGSLTGTIDFGGGPISNAIYLVAFDAGGAFKWQKVLPNQAWPTLPATLQITVDPSGSLIVASSSKTLDLGDGPPLQNQKGLFVAKLSP